MTAYYGPRCVVPSTLTHFVTAHAYAIAIPCCLLTPILEFSSSLQVRGSVRWKSDTKFPLLVDTSDHLKRGERLACGQFLRSGGYQLGLDSSGIFNIKDASGKTTTYSTGGSMSNVCQLVYTSEGLLELRDNRNQVVKAFKPFTLEPLANWRVLRASNDTTSTFRLNEDGRAFVSHLGVETWSMDDLTCSPPGTYNDRFSLSTLWPKGTDFKSKNGLYKLVMQYDGNLVLYNAKTEKALWQSGTWDKGDAFYLTDGSNLVIYSFSRKDFVWKSTNTAISGGFQGAPNITSITYELVMRNDGNAVINAVVSAGSQVQRCRVWSTQTQGL